MWGTSWSQWRFNLFLIATALIVFKSCQADGGYSAPEGECDSADHKEECQGSGSVLSRISRLKLDGLNGKVTLPNLQHFPKNEEPGVDINIIREIVGSKVTKEFGTNLLQDDDGTEMGILQEKWHSDSVKILTEAFEIWIRGQAGLGPRSWRSLVKCLREERLTILADNIENYLALPTDTSSPYEVPSLWKNKDEDRFRKVFGLLQSVRFSVDSVASELKKTGLVIEKVSSELSRLISRLLDQNVRIGIVGLTKAGKSTFLNALLGKSFLPSSVEPQTANETVLIHDMDKSNGELTCIVSGKTSTLASGQQEIFRKLLGFNKETRKSKSGTSKKCDKLILHAPLKFLASSESKDVKLELSDTPGFGEAGADKITATVASAVKELCAFILILNSDYMKSESEANLLKKLQKYHPELFSELNRVLILVNGRESVYKEGKLHFESASVTPDNVPQYVSEYFSKPDFLNIHISQEKIILFNALWALKCREWKSTSILKKDHKEANTLYDEAILMLRYFNEDDEADRLNGKVDEKNINDVISLLEPHTKINEIENLLRKMVVENGGLVLLESAVDDTISVINYSVLPTITDLVDNEELKAKENELLTVKELDDLVSRLITDSEAICNEFYRSLSSSTRAHITALRDMVQESLSNVASSKLMDGLREIVQLEDKNKVVSEMRKARDAIPGAALVKMRSEWLTLSETIRSTAENELKRIFSDLKAFFLSSIGKVNKGGKGSSNSSKLAEELASSIPLLLVAASDSSASLLPDLSTLAIEELALSGNAAVQDDAIATHIHESKKQKFRTNNRKKCSGGFLFWRGRCVFFTEAIPYDQSVFSPDVSGLKAAFDEVVQSWVSLYDVQVGKYLSDISSLTGNAGIAKIKSIMKEPHRKVTKMLQASQSALDEAQQNVAFLEQKREDVEKLRELLSSSMSI